MPFLARRNLEPHLAVASFSHDGIELARVKKKSRWLPIWHIVFVVYLAFVIRLVSMAEIGPAAYANRMAELENGTVFERVAAKAMFMDPVSHNLATKIRAGLRNLGAI